MNCERFERWLDDGAPEGTGGDLAVVTAAEEFRDHAATCARCAAALAAARELESLLAAPLRSRAAPAGFTARVMERVEWMERLAPHVGYGAELRQPPVAESMPWWVRAAAEPAAALAFALAALLLWKRDAMLAAAGSMLAQASGSFAATATAAGRTAGWLQIPAVFMRPEILLGVAFAIAPALVWASWRLWRWGEARAA